VQAKWLLQKVLALRGEEPQSYRELALAHRACKEYQEAIDLLWKVREGEERRGEERRGEERRGKERKGERWRKVENGRERRRNV